MYTHSIKRYYCNVRNPGPVSQNILRTRLYLRKELEVNTYPFHCSSRIL